VALLAIDPGDHADDAEAEANDEDCEEENAHGG
jgi:hypothetical protein